MVHLETHPLGAGAFLVEEENPHHHLSSWLERWILGGVEFPVVFDPHQDDVALQVAKGSLDVALVGRARPVLVVVIVGHSPSSATSDWNVKGLHPCNTPMLS